MGYKGGCEKISYSRTVDKTNRNEKQPILLKLAVWQCWLASFDAGQANSLTYSHPARIAPAKLSV
jgi:hypothetical protein